MRWKHAVAGLALAVNAIVGCSKPCFIHECDSAHYQNLAPMIALESDATKWLEPVSKPMPRPSTVLDPDRDLYFMTLSEAVARALESGTTGSAGGANQLIGNASDNLVSFTGRGLVGSDSVRVLSLDPAIVGADIESALSKFDVLWNTSLNWNTSDSATGGTFFTQFQPNGQNARFSTSLLKPLPTGGVAGITFDTSYIFRDASVGQNISNPAYVTSLQFQFEQPLLQGYGVEINQLRATHPGSILNPFAQTGRTEGILIARIRFDQQRADFERQVHQMLLNVELAYWGLYNAYWNLYSREAGLRQSYAAWRVQKARYEAGTKAVQELAQTRQQYETFRAQRLTAVAQVLESERQLRGLLGMQREDGKRIIPIDTPTLTPYHPDWNTAVNEALALKPELILAREDLKARQLELINQKNQILPDLRFTSSYDLNGTGSRLDGRDSNAFRSLAQDRFNNWGLGLRMTMPLGYRDARAQLRVSRLNLARSYRILEDQELKAQGFLALQFRRLFQFHNQIEIQRSVREATAQQLEARYAEFAAGKGTLEFLLDAQRVWADALRDEYDAIVQYNNSLAAFDFAKGTILQRYNVSIAEGLLPNCATERAVEAERRRDKAIILRERVLAPELADPETLKDPVPKVPGQEAAAVSPSVVPSLLEDRRAIEEQPFQLPAVAAGRPAQRTDSVPAPRPTAIPKAPTNLEPPRALPPDVPDAGKVLKSLPKLTEVSGTDKAPKALPKAPELPDVGKGPRALPKAPELPDVGKAPRALPQPPEDSDVGKTLKSIPKPPALEPGPTVGTIILESPR